MGRLRDTLRHYCGSPLTGSPNKRVSGSGFQPSSKSPSGNFVCPQNFNQNAEKGHEYRFTFPIPRV